MFVSVILLLICFIVSYVSPAPACTMWAAAGTAVREGALIARNHDGYSGIHDELRLVIPLNGLRFLGLYSFRKERTINLVAGINEKGLVVTSIDPEKMAETKSVSATKKVEEMILSSFDTVESVMRNQEIFEESGSAFYLIADRSRVLVVEKGPAGFISVKGTTNGFVYHTDHYCDDMLKTLNKTVDTGSALRLARIESLLSNKTAPLTIEDFIDFSDDRKDGPDNSIWRSIPDKSNMTTLATWIVFFPAKGPQELYARFSNEKDPENPYIVNMLINDQFWTEGLSQMKQ